MAENVEFTDANFEDEVLKSDIPVLVDFWAEWCAPCKIVSPVVQEIADDYEGKLKVGKINVDRHAQVAARFGIRSIPTLMIFKDGKVADQIVGAVPKKHVAGAVDRVIT